MNINRKLFLTFLLALSFVIPANSSGAKVLLGISPPEPQGPTFAVQLQDAFINLVTIHSYSDNKTLLNMLTKFNKLDAVLISKQTFNQQNNANLISLAEVNVSGGPHESTLILASHENIPQATHNILLQGYQELLLGDIGLELLEKYAASVSERTLIGDPREAPRKTAGNKNPRNIDTNTVLQTDNRVRTASLDAAAMIQHAPEVSPAQTSVKVATGLSQPGQKDKRTTTPTAPTSSGKPLLAKDRLPSAVNNKTWQPHVDIQGKLGNERSLGELELFLPVAQNMGNLLFLDLRFQADDSDSTEGNFGIGYRKLIHDTWILGGYGFYDLRRSQHGNRFKQMTLGAEALTEEVDLRINMYLADKDRYLVAKQAASDQIIYSGINLVHEFGGTAFETWEKSMSGYDAEFGWLFPWFKAQEVRGYIGGYHFSASGVEDIAGPYGRLAVRFPDIFDVSGSLFELGGEIRHDDTRETDYFISARARIPFGSVKHTKGNRTRLDRRMTERIQRDPDIIVAQLREDSSTPAQREILTAGGAPLTIAHADSQSSAGDGSVETPFQSLTDAINTGSDIVLLNAGSVFAGEAVTLNADQRLLGATVAHTTTINTDKFGLINLPTAALDGNMPVIKDVPGTAIALANGSEVSGIQISASGTALHGTDVGGVSINRNVITNVDTAIFLDGLTSGQGTISIIDNQVQAAADDGIVILNRDPGSVSLVVTDNRLEQIGTPVNFASGIVIENSGLELSATIAENSINGSTGEGIYSINKQDGGTLSLTVANNLVNQSEFDGLGIYNFGETLNLALHSNHVDGDTDNLWVDYFFENLQLFTPTATFNLGVSAGHPAIGSTINDPASSVIEDVIISEANTRADMQTSPVVDFSGTISIIDKETISTP